MVHGGWYRRDPLLWIIMSSSDSRGCNASLRIMLSQSCPFACRNHQHACGNESQPLLWEFCLASCMQPGTGPPPVCMHMRLSSILGSRTQHRWHCTHTAPGPQDSCDKPELSPQPIDCLLKYTIVQLYNCCAAPRCAATKPSKSKATAAKRFPSAALPPPWPRMGVQAQLARSPARGRGLAADPDMPLRTTVSSCSLLPRKRTATWACTCRRMQ